MTVQVVAATPAGTAAATFTLTAATIPGWLREEEMGGPRVPLTPSASVTSSRDGQIIEGLEVSGRIVIQHNNVTVRDCRVLHGDYPALYPIFIRARTGYPYPTGTLIEWSEVRGVGTYQNHTPAVYGAGGGWTLRNSNLVRVTRGALLRSGCVMESCYVRADGVWDPVRYPDLHRSGSGISYGADNVVRDCHFEITPEAASGAFVMYTDGGNRNQRATIEGNYFDGGSYSLYAGDGEPTLTDHLVFRNNRFGRAGIFGAATSYDADQRDGINGTGNVWAADNVYADTLAPVRPEWH